MLETIAQRHSVRKFLAKPVEAEKIEALLRAGMQAPSAMNQQSWEFVVIDQREILDELSKIQYANPLVTAPLAIAILAKRQVVMPQFVNEEIGACSENILLEAVNQDLGAVWLGIDKEDDADRQQVYKRILQVDDNYTVAMCLAIGYPDETEHRFKDRFDPAKVHHNALHQPYKL